MTQKLKEFTKTVTRLLPLLSFAIPILILYFSQDVAYPSYPYLYYDFYGRQVYTNTFEATWKGRTFYMFFIWLFFLEMVLGWEELKTAVSKLRSTRTLALTIALLLPTIYVLTANFYGLNKTIESLTRLNNVPFAGWMPLSTEYLVFTVLFALTILLAYDFKGLGDFSISLLFLGTIGLIYTVDNLFPYGRFTPFQFLVPTTATLSAGVLNLMGYGTAFLPSDRGTPRLMVSASGRLPWTADIAWPCSGIDSLLIYTVTILLFLKKSAIPWTQRIAYFVIGAVITYLINVLRIVTIFVLGVNGGDAWLFHNYYGQLYSIAWIISYPLIIIGTRAMWTRIRSWQAYRNAPVVLGNKPQARAR